MENVAQETEKAISGAIKVDEKEIRDHLDGLVRQSVEDTLNALLNAGRVIRIQSSIFSGEDTNHRHAEKGFSLKLGSDSCRRLGFDNF